MGEPTKPADTLTRVVQFYCTQKHYTKGFRPFGMEGETERVTSEANIDKELPVTIRNIPGESPEQTHSRFLDAAGIEQRGILYRREASSCSDVVRFLPTAEEALKAQAARKAERRSFFFDMLTAYGKSMDDCQKATGSYILCKPQP